MERKAGSPQALPSKSVHVWHFTRFWPFQAIESAPASRGNRLAAKPGHRFGRGEHGAAPVGAALQLDLPGSKPLRTNENLPRNADQIGGRELRAGALVRVVIEH